MSPQKDYLYLIGATDDLGRGGPEFVVVCVMLGAKMLWHVGILTREREFAPIATNCR